jgi:hypothetical protein
VVLDEPCPGSMSTSSRARTVCGHRGPTPTMPTTPPPASPISSRSSTWSAPTGWPA